MSLDPADPWREWAFGEFLTVAGQLLPEEAYAELAERCGLPSLADPFVYGVAACGPGGEPPDGPPPDRGHAVRGGRPRDGLPPGPVLGGHGPMSLGGLNYEELEALVRSWPWWSPDPVLVGTVQLISGLTRGLGLPGIVLARGSGHTHLAMVSATIFSRAFGGRSYSCCNPTPLVAALMVCWRALLGEGQTPPPELDELITGAILRGELAPAAFGVSWAEVELLYRDRPCPPEVLARAAVELALGHGGRRVP